MAFERLGQELSCSVSSDGRQVLTYTLPYLYTSSSATELSVIGVQSALGLRPGVGFADDPNATLQSIRIRRRLTRVPHCSWDVDIIYATNAKVPENDSQDPTQHRVKRYKRYQEQTKNVIEDRDGNLIVNAAGEPFKDGVAVADYPYSYVYEWNRTRPTNGFHKKINLNAFNGCDPGELLCLISTEEVFEGAWNYWKETIEMRHNPLGWQPRPVNAGLKERVSGLTTLKDCVDAHGQKFTEPQPLYDAESEDDDPLHIEGTMVPFDDRPDGCKFLEVDHFESAAFENIGVREFPE